MELSLATRTVAEHTVLEVGGEVDVYTAPRLRERLVELVDGGARQVVVDLGRVDFLDSTGLGVLVGALKRLRAAGGSFALVCDKEPLLKIFRITALDQVFPLLPHGRRGGRRRPDRRRRVMATVRLSFSPAPVHVRTARLVGVAVARRAGVAEDLLDEVRLAIGEACTRAVALHRQYGLADPVLVEMSDAGSYAVRVIDRAPIEAGHRAGRAAAGRAGQRVAHRRGADHRRRLRPARRLRRGPPGAPGRRGHRHRGADGLAGRPLTPSTRGRVPAGARPRRHDRAYIRFRLMTQRRRSSRHGAPWCDLRHVRRATVPGLSASDPSRSQRVWVVIAGPLEWVGARLRVRIQAPAGASPPAGASVRYRRTQMSGTLAADGGGLSLTGSNVTYVVIAAVIALVALGFAAALTQGGAGSR